jgi:hypothetical protein
MIHGMTPGLFSLPPTPNSSTHIRARSDRQFYHALDDAGRMAPFVKCSTSQADPAAGGDGACMVGALP